MQQYCGTSDAKMKFIHAAVIHAAVHGQGNAKKQSKDLGKERAEKNGNLRKSAYKETMQKVKAKAKQIADKDAASATKQQSASTDTSKWVATKIMHRVVNKIHAAAKKVPGDAHLLAD